MSSVAQLEAEIYIGRGVFLKKIINPDFFLDIKKSLKYQKLHTLKKLYSKFQVDRTKIE